MPQPEETDTSPNTEESLVADAVKETQNAPILPDGEQKPEDKLSDLTSKVESYTEKEKRWNVEKELMEKRVKDSQNEFHKKRDGREEPKKEPEQQQGESLKEYKTRLLDMLAEDPSVAFSTLIDDFAKDKYMSNQETTKLITEAEERAYQRALRADPSRAELFQKVEELDNDRPDLANFTLEQKLEFVKMNEGVDKNNANDKLAGNERDNAKRGQDLMTSTRRGTNKKSAIPAFYDDPEIQKAAKKMGFTSTSELAEHSGKVLRGE